MDTGKGSIIRRMLGLFGALACLAAALPVSTRLRESSLATAEAEARRRAELSRVALREGLSGALKDLEGQATAVASIGPIKSLAGSPDRPTIEDALAHEPWWQPQRDQFAASGLLFGDAALDTIVGPLSGPVPADLFQAAGRSRVASAVISLRGQPALAATAVIDLPSRSAAIFLARALDAATLSSLAARARAPLALSDGRRIVAVSSAEWQALRGLGGREASGVIVDERRRWGAAAEPAGEGAWLWSLASTDDVAASAERAAASATFVTWSVAALAAIALLLLGLRRTAPIADPVLLREASRQLEEARQQLARMTPPLDATAPRMSPPSPIPLTSEMPQADGAVFGRYHLVDRIGTGGMGEIYTAVAFGAEGFKRGFVVKRLRAEISGEPELVTQFIDEARLGARLLHSNIVPIFDFGKVGATYYLAQEYVSGRDVDHLVQRALTRDGKPPPLATTLHVAHAVLQALAYAHALADPSGQPMGLVHRDVSPNNVLVSSRGDVKLLDFGIVKATGRSTETRSGMVKGNVNCMSPEQAQGLAVDARADLFSLAMTLFRLASGTALYGAGTAFELLVRAAAGPTADDLARVRALGGPLAAALEKALQPDREKRFASATEFAAALPPAPPSAAAETGALVARLFAEELQGEQTRMDAVTPPAARASQ